jgi:two-component system, cell cycle response regulator CtrA
MFGPTIRCAGNSLPRIACPPSKNLPDMSWFEVLRSLRVSKVRTPILILSGLAGIEDKVSGLGFGADDYMTKPFHKDELVARIHAIVRRSKGHAQSVATPAISASISIP